MYDLGNLLIMKHVCKVSEETRINRFCSFHSFTQRYLLYCRFWFQSLIGRVISCLRLVRSVDPRAQDFDNCYKIPVDDWLFKLRVLLHHLSMSFDNIDRSSDCYYYNKLICSIGTVDVDWWHQFDIDRFMWYHSHRTRFSNNRRSPAWCAKDT